MAAVSAVMVADASSLQVANCRLIVLLLDVQGFRRAGCLAAPRLQAERLMPHLCHVAHLVQAGTEGTARTPQSHN